MSQCPIGCSSACVADRNNTIIPSSSVCCCWFAHHYLMVRFPKVKRKEKKILDYTHTLYIYIPDGQQAEKSRRDSAHTRWTVNWSVYKFTYILQVDQPKLSVCVGVGVCLEGNSFFLFILNLKRERERESKPEEYKKGLWTGAVQARAMCRCTDCSSFEPLAS